jgi:hypothetical protein
MTTKELKALKRQIRCENRLSNMLFAAQRYAEEANLEEFNGPATRAFIASFDRLKALRAQLPAIPVAQSVAA